jgi:hypothetical protein
MLQSLIETAAMNQINLSLIFAVTIMRRLMFFPTRPVSLSTNLQLLSFCEANRPMPSNQPENAKIFVLPSTRVGQGLKIRLLPHFFCL